MVLNCPEFAASIAALRAVQDRGAPSGAGGDSVSHFGDLCSTCQDRDCCILPRPPGGIWRCANYRG